MASKIANLKEYGFHAIKSQLSAVDLERNLVEYIPQFNPKQLVVKVNYLIINQKNSLIALLNLKF